MPLNRAEMPMLRLVSSTEAGDIAPIVQGFAAVVVVSSDWTIRHVSQTAPDILGLTAPLFGERLGAVLPRELVHDLRQQLTVHGMTRSTGRRIGVGPDGGGALFDITAHVAGSDIVLEFEPCGEDETRDLIGLVRGLAVRLREAEDDDTVMRKATMALKLLTGFDHAVLFRMETGGSARVAAEAQSDDGRPGLTGLRCPGRTLPADPEEGLTAAPMRLIRDVSLEPQTLASAHGCGEVRPDLSLAVSRAATRRQVDYLSVMDARALLTVPVVRNGRVWGLFACHAAEPRTVGFRLRSAIELFVQLFANDLNERATAAEEDRRAAAAAFQRRLVAEAASLDLPGKFDLLHDELARIIRFDGFAIYAAGAYQAAGYAPGEDRARPLARRLRQLDPSTVFSSCRAREDLAGLDAFSDGIAGVLAIPVSQTRDQFILLFRREQARSVTWAMGARGEEVAPGRARLERAAGLWSEVIRGQSEEWSETELRSAETVRITMLEVVLKLSRDAAEQRRKTAERHGVLIAELNHRVRNILSMMTGLVAQQAAHSQSVPQLERALNARILALGRAHDQLTATNWGASSLRHLIDVELRAYAGAAGDTVMMMGEDADIAAEAFSTVALVIHEMVTNSVKYGALSQASGRLRIAIGRSASGGLTLDWRERGGPPVPEIRRRGFGSTIIEDSLRFELGGKAEVTFSPDGLDAVFEIPARHVVAFSRPARTRVARPVAAPADMAHLPRSVLVVEDNIIIAMDMVAQLEHAGVERIETASNVAEALSRLEDFTPDAALLDVALGDETSYPVADRLIELGSKVVLATGYSPDDAAISAYDGFAVLNKPIAAEALIATLCRAMAAP